VASSAVTRDFYQQILHPEIDEKKLMGLSKKVTLILAILSLGVALAVSVLSPTRTVFWFVIFGWSGIAATFCPVIILSIFWKDYTEKGAIATMVTGFLCIPFFKFVVPNISTLEPYINKLDVMLPSVLLAMLAGWATSTFLKN
jgi:Na+/proline symporter